MDFTQITGYLLYGVLLFITTSWALGVRLKPDLTYSTILGSFYFVVLSIIFPFLHINYLHLLWLIPIGFVLAIVSNVIFINRVPILDNSLRIVLTIYTNILRIGMNQQKMERKRELAATELIEELTKRKQNIDRDKLN